MKTEYVVLLLLICRLKSVLSHSALLTHLSVSLLCSQASVEASLRALESLMTEFFHSCTTNDRKREIGEFLYYFFVYSVIFSSH